MLYNTPVGIWCVFRTENITSAWNMAFEGIS